MVQTKKSRSKDSEEKQKIDVLTLSQANVTGFIMETCMDHEGKYHLLINKENGNATEFRNGIQKNNQILIPTDFRIPITTHYASGIEEYGSDQQLFDEVRQFIHERVDLEPVDELTSTLFVFLTYIKEVLSNSPYIHVLGQYGKGKTTYFKTVGSICYNPIAANGASTLASIERLVHELRGTLLLDECDWSPIKRNEWYSLLRSGYDRTQPYLKNIPVDGGWQPAEFDVFGAKILISYERFDDDALNSRCFEIVMKTKTRDLVSVETATFMESVKVLSLRNKLLLWKAKNLDRIESNYEHSLFDDIDSSGRIKQVMRPMGNIVKICLGIESPLFNEILSVLEGLNTIEIQRKAETMEAKLLKVLYNLQDKEKFRISDIKDSSDFEDISNQSIGMKMQKLTFDKWKKHDNKGTYYTMDESFKESLKKTAKEYGIEVTERECIARELPSIKITI